MRILLAVGEPTYAQILRDRLVTVNFEIIDSDVYHRRFLEEIIEVEKPDIVILHDTFLPSDFKELHEKENEILSMIEKWRILYKDKIRVVYLCERNRTDPFLGKLVARNVLDIFYQREIPAQSLLDQLTNPPEFKNVSKLGVGLYEIQEEKKENINNNDIEEGSMDEHDEPSTESNNNHPEKSVKNELIDKLKAQLSKKENVSASLQPKKIVKKEIKIQFGRNKVQTVGLAIPRQLFVVAGGQHRVGSTFIAHQMAYAFSQFNIGVTYLENPYQKAYTYERLDGTIKYPDYKSLFQRIAQPDRNIPKMFLEEGNIAFVVLNPLQESTYSEKDLEVEGVLRLLLNVHEKPIVIVDIGNDLSSSFSQEMLNIASKVFFVMDHDVPGAIHYNQNTLSQERLLIEKMKLEKRFQFIINRSIKACEAEMMFNEDAFYYPEIPSEVVFKSQLEGTLEFLERTWKKQQSKLVLPLIEEWIPELLKKQVK